jgi:Tfp pilus assembly protein PilN
MIRVNLIGATKKKAATASKIALPSTATPFIILLIVLATAGGGYWWYTNVTNTSADLDTKIASAQAQKAALDAVIKQNQIYESSKKALENRIKVIEGLERNQVSPVVALDLLSDAIQRTQYVWLSQLEQNNAILSMTGTATSLNALADFQTNLKNTRHFRNIDLNNATDTSGNFTFSLKCEFAPPMPETAAAIPVTPQPAATNGGH